MVFFCNGIACAQKEDWNFPKEQDEKSLGINIQRTMQKLHRTNEAKSKEEVRILFYGQSFVKQDYWLEVAADLKKRFPNSNLNIKNLAIGGFVNSFLNQTVHVDVIPFYPDLVIYQAQGSHHDLDSTIRLIRTHTTAEIILMNSIWKVADEKNPALGWSEIYSHNYIPLIAAKYGCGYIDTRTLWHEYLNDNKLKAEVLLDETGHMNKFGEFLHGELVKPYFKLQPKFPELGYSGAIQSLKKNKDFSPSKNGISFTATGNKIEIYFEEKVPEDFIAEIKINGKKPSEYKGAFAATRPNGATELDWPWEVYAFNNVMWDATPLEEEWQLKVTEAGERSEWIKFEVEGSKTGLDGNGDSREVFRSNSGRVIIDPSWWHLKRSFGFMSAREDNKVMTAGKAASGTKETANPIYKDYEFKWKIRQLGYDQINSNDVKARNGVIVIAQGIPNKSHEIEILTLEKNADLIKEFKVYQPPIKK